MGRKAEFRMTMTDEELLAAVEQAAWKSTNYGGEPHQYILKEWAPPTPEVFVDIAARIAERGRKSFYKGYPYIVLVLDDFYYWRMRKANWSVHDAPEKTLINRRSLHVGEPIVWANERLPWDIEKKPTV